MFKLQRKCYWCKQPSLYDISIGSMVGWRYYGSCKNCLKKRQKEKGVNNVTYSEQSQPVICYNFNGNAIKCDFCEEQYQYEIKDPSERHCSILLCPECYHSDDLQNRYATIGKPAKEKSAIRLHLSEIAFKKRVGETITDNDKNFIKMSKKLLRGNNG